MYLLHVPDHYPKFGKAFGHKVGDGICMVSRQADWHTMIRHGFTDVTPANWGRSFDKPEKLEDLLLIHKSGAGDACLMTPLCRAFAEKYPGIKIRVATNLIGAMMLVNNPYVSDMLIEKDEYVPYYHDDFDDVINFNGIMTKSHEANLVNVYDMFAAWAGIELPDERKRPEIYLTPGEKKAAEKWLADRGCAPGDKLVTIQLSASSPVRSVDEWKMIELAKRIRDDGYKVFVFGKTQLGLCHYFICSCGHKQLFPKPANVLEGKIMCPRCKSITDTTFYPGIPGLMASDGSTSIRTIAAIIERASFHIGPDSVGNHLAAAFDVPALGLFSSFDADMRLRYYPKARWIQKPAPCAPCFAHHMQCKANNGEVARCMSYFTVDEMYTEFKRMEAGEPWEKPVPFTPCATPRACPVCGGNRRRYVNRKGTVCYQECLECRAVYADKEVEVADNNISYYEGYVTPGYIAGQQGSAEMLHSRFYRPGEINNVLDLGCGVSHTLAKMNELGWNTLGLKHSQEAIAETKRRYPGVNIFDHDIMGVNGKFSLIWLNNVLEHFHQPRPLLKKLWDLLVPGGHLSIQIPDLQRWRELLFAGKWDGVNNSYAGEHTVLYGRETLTWMMEQEGFGDPVVEKMPGPDCLWMSFRKVPKDAG